MRKQFKRTLAMLLVLVMVLAMLPTVAAAADEMYPASPLTELPADNQAVVIFSASAGAVFAGTASGGAVGACAAKTTEESKDIYVGNGAGVYKLMKNSDGTYYITCGGKYLWVDSSEKIDLKATAEKGTKWKIAAASGFSGYTIVNADYKYGNYDIYLEYYNSFKAWTCKEVSEIYCFDFYAIDEATADPDGDGYIGKKPVSGEKPADGDKVVIYNDYGGVCFSFQSDDPLAPSMTGAVSSLDESGNIAAGNGSLIFEVGFDGTYYTFKNNGKYLRTSPNEAGENGKINNAECLYMDELDSEYSYWTLGDCTGGYMMVNKTAKYGSSPVAIEFFSNSFSGWTYNGSENLFAMRFFPAEDTLGLGYVLNPKMAIKAENAYLGVDYDFEVTLDELTKVTEMTMTYKTNDGTETKLQPTSVDGYKYTYTVPQSALSGKKTLTLKGVAKNEYDLTYSGEVTVNIEDEPLIVSVSPMSNEATGNEKRPTITVTLANCGDSPKVEMLLDGTAVNATLSGNKLTYKPSANLTDDRHTVAVTVTRTDGKKVEMTWSFFVGEAGMSLYFGQIHSHTAEYSDGAGQLEDAYEYAMKAADVDFMIVTDHSNYFDTTKTATTSSYYDLSSLTKIGDLTKWEEAKKTAEEYNAKSDDFICAYGYEMTWSGGPGHTNTFNTYGTVSRNNAELNNKTGYAGMHRYNDLMVNADRGLDIDGNPVAEGVKTKWIEDAPVVSQFNHPGTTFGTFDTYAGYTPVRDTVLCLIEVGNGEGLVGGSSYWPSYSEYDKCLAKGWHVAPTNNQDNHKGKWGDSNTCRDVIMTDDFTEAGLYKAMAERRVYSTEDQNLRIYYTLNGELMGSIIDVGDTAPTEVNVVASISDPDGESLGTIEIIGENGLTLAKFDAPGSTYELNTTIKNTDSYYYIKVTEKDGDIAVTAPVWVGVATPIIADIGTDAALSVVGETEKLTATVNNAADKDYTLSKVVFTLIDAEGKETVINTIEDTSVVKAGESKTVEFDYKRTVSGTQEIVVVFYGTYNGKEFKCRASLKSKVYKADELTKVAVDYGHGNFYVSGGYSDNMGNFIRFCADNGVMAEFLQKGEMTYEKLKYYKMVVLTVPFDSGNLEPSAYTAEELAALKKYAERGGNLIVCTKSDRKSPSGEMNCAALTNSILEAIGANVRAADGIIVDNDMKANEAYRIYFSSKENINTEHRFTKAAYTSSNAYGTKPATDNSTGFQLYNAAPILINEGAEDKVTKLVKGYQSTWGASYTANFDGSAYVPDYNADKVTAEMGDVNIITYEELKGGGWLVVSGCTFFSNYDIKDDTDYINKFIVKNIIRDLTDTGETVKVTPIAEVKQKTKGTYTIEGYITANASGYDQDTAFFDCTYVQDKNGNGINVFPVAGNYAIGMNVRCFGGVTFYCGEIELNLGSEYNGEIRIISDDTYTIAPKEVDCATAMADSSIGNLMKVKGIITNIHKTEGVIDKIYVRDAAGEACLFINGYIMKDYTGLDNLKVGMMVSGVGIGSRDVDSESATSEIFARLRVRNRAEIKVLDDQVHSDLIFSDVSTTDWFYEYVTFAAERGLLQGIGHSMFDPEANLTRAMVATVLYRLAGKPSVSGKGGFKDVEAGTWYTDAVAWAEEVGVVKGYEDATFRPDNKITRQEMAVMLARYAEKVAGLKIEAEGNLNSYADGSTVADWARDAIVWFVDTGILTGIDGKIVPNGLATRAQFATIITRYVQRFDGVNE